MPTYKLSYFNGRGRAETIRMILTQGGAAFEDCRLEGEEWAKLKPKTPLGKMPILETDGHVLAESTAISRLLAKRFGLNGADEFEAATIDMLVCAVDEVAGKFAPWFMEQDPEKKKTIFAQIMTDHAKPFAEKMEVVLAGNKSGFFVGKNLTWADLHLYNFFSQMPEEKVKNYPQLAAFLKKVAELPKIKSWIEKRPSTPW